VGREMCTMDFNGNYKALSVAPCELVEKVGVADGALCGWKTKAPIFYCSKVDTMWTQGYAAGKAQHEVVRCRRDIYLDRAVGKSQMERFSMLGVAQGPSGPATADHAMHSALWNAWDKKIAQEQGLKTKRRKRRVRARRG